MYDYYAQAAVCFAYLQDVSWHNWQTAFDNSRWFTRGWTLQELLAPTSVKFFTCDRVMVGDRASLGHRIHGITGIAFGISVDNVPFVERYKWALGRQTTKAEDKSYCVLGLLEIKLIPNYGEGEDTARERLFREIESEHGRRTGRELRQAYLEWQVASKVALARQVTLPVEDAATRGSSGMSPVMKMLHFPDMDSRRGTISDPFPDTCTWLLSDPDYQKWFAMKGCRFLWIKGKPGAGKSTLVKFVFSQAKSKHGGATLSFFFNARGTELERTTSGMYRSLVYQLLEYAPYLESSLLADVHIIDDRTWTLQETQAALRILVMYLREPVQCFIDALDECTIAEVQTMVHFFEDMGRTPNSKLFICFASRFYPTITIANSVPLLLDHQVQHTNDLVNYVNGRLAVAEDDQGRALRLRVIKKANGVFFWAVLVIRLLNKELSSGSIFNVQRRLDELPDELGELLREIVVKDTSEPDQFKLCLQWVLFGHKPLRRSEYYYAIVTGLCEAGLAEAWAYQDPWDKSQVTLDYMGKFVSSSSRGLAEVTKAGTVQFIHESVRDLFLKYNGLQTLFPGIATEDLHCWIHNNLRNICLRYLTVVTQGLDNFHRFPFLDHAACAAVLHANQAALRISQRDFFDQSDGVRKFFESTGLGMDVINPEGVPLARCTTVHILARLGADRLIPIAHDLGHALDHLDTIPPLQLAIGQQQLGAIQALIECGVDVNEVFNGITGLHLCANAGPFAGIMANWLLKHNAAVDMRNDEGDTPLLRAAKCDASNEVIRVLIQYKANVNARDANGMTCVMHSSISKKQVLKIDPLRKGVQQEMENPIRLFINQGADINAKNKRGKSALMLACELGHESVVQELLLRQADRTLVDADGKTAFDLADEAGHEDIKFLFSLPLYVIRTQATAGAEQNMAPLI